MTIEDKKTYLKQYKRAKAKIDVLEKELYNLAFDMLPGGIDYSKDKVQTTATSDQMINYMIRVEELVEHIKRRRQDAVDTCTSIMDAIDTVENDTYQTVLHRRYILLQTWEEIALSMNYSVQWVYLTHGEALAEIQIPKD